MARDARFDDLLQMRAGGPDLTMGAMPSSIVRISRPEEWAAKAAALRELFIQTLGRMPDVSCPLDPEVLAEKDRGTHVERTVAFNVEPDERISAYVLMPKGLKGRAPGMLCIHPTTPLGMEQAIGNDPSEGGRDRAYALHLVRRGYVTFAWDLMGAGRRCFPGCPAFETGPFYRKHPDWSARGKDLWDARRAVDLLLTLDEVDSGRIGSIGHSQGGGITIHAMALDERIAAGVSSCGEWPSRLSKNPFNHARTGWWVGRPFLRPYCLAGKDFPIDLHEYLALIAPRAIMAITAVNDNGYGPDEEAAARSAYGDLEENVSRVFSLLGAAGAFRSVLHARGHGFAAEEREVAYAFLDERLGAGAGARRTARQD